MRPAILKERGYGRDAIAEVLQHPERERLASALAIGVSEPMIAWARKIVRCGTDELIAAVEDGRVALYMGAKIARRKPWEQRNILAAACETSTVTSCVMRPRAATSGSAAASPTATEPQAAPTAAPDRPTRTGSRGSADEGLSLAACSFSTAATTRRV